ncbi:MAG TPA: nodulation protein NfeD [Patescibacteria group bacterium]|nr:nodulation protein NfeD [Patescibacteria group bacterium]
MKKFLKPLATLFWIAGFLLFQATSSPAQDEEAPPVNQPLAVVIKVEGMISPATLDLVKRGLEDAAKRKADVVVLQMQTPGGLYDSMQTIIQLILESPVPVATYVSPPGSHAASAGTYILYASHIAAMAPSTVIGAATPIRMGDNSPMQPSPDPSMQKIDPSSVQPKSTLEHKMVNDAAAYIRGLAELRNRNAEWAERAVRDAVSATATESLASKAIDLIAVDVNELLEKIDGRVVKMAGNKTMKLNTKNARFETHEADWRTGLLDVIASPNVAFMLMTLGSYGLIYEVLNPGAILPGVVGIISFILGLFAMNVLPVDYTGLALMLVGMALMIGEAFSPSFGALGIGGAISFAVGATMLIDSVDPNFGVDPWLIAAVTVGSLGFLSVLLAVAFKAQRSATMTGQEELKQTPGEVLNWSQGQGEVRITGEIWRASAASPEFIINPGDRVKVVEIDGLRLIVRPE